MRLEVEVFEIECHLLLGFGCARFVFIKDNIIGSTIKKRGNNELFRVGFRCTFHCFDGKPVPGVLRLY